VLEFLHCLLSCFLPSHIHEWVMVRVEAIVLSSSPTAQN
jgi:hypothetical protein